MSNLFKIINNQKKSIFYSLIIYVLLFVILIYTGINTPKIQEEIEFFFDFSQQEELLKQQENALKDGNDLMPEDKLNVAVNEALKDNPLSNPYDYYNMPEQSDEYKEQLIKDALQDEYEDYANKEYKIDESYYADINKKNNDKTEKNDSKNNYQGATFVKYYLEDRSERRLIIPTYACEQSGQVVVQIVVNKGGQVLRAELKNANGSAKCLIDAAIDAAKRSTFLRNNNAPEKQVGTISYTFKEQ